MVPALRRLLITGVAVIALAAAGCTADDDPPDSPPTTPATGPMTTSVEAPTPPELPDEARAHTTAGAKAFVRFYIGFSLVRVHADGGADRSADSPPRSVRFVGLSLIESTKCGRAAADKRVETGQSCRQYVLASTSLRRRT